MDSTRFCRTASSAHTSAGSRSTRVAAIWPILMYTPPASSRTRRRRTPVGSTLRSARSADDSRGPKPSRRSRPASSRYRRSTEIRRCRARNGRGATTSPARSPTASVPGLASRSKATAVAIVNGMPIATTFSTSPSEPQSQSLRPSDTAPAVPQPTTPANKAVVHPRRIPSRRSDRLVITAANASPMTIRSSTAGSDAASVVVVVMAHRPRRAGRPRRRAFARCRGRPR